MGAVVAGAVLAMGLAGCGGWPLGRCQQGSPDPSLTLVPAYVNTHPGITSIRVCVRGGGCASQQVHIAGWSSVPGPAGPAGPARRVAIAEVMEFGRLIPAGVASQGPHGPALHIRVTAYAGARMAVSAAGVFSPVSQIPASSCEPRSYYVTTWLTQSGTLTFYRLA